MRVTADFTWLTPREGGGGAVLPIMTSMGGSSARKGTFF